VLRPLLSVLGVFMLVGMPTTTARAASVTEFRIPTANSGPNGITAGPDGALWFTEQNSNKIGRITTSGSIREFRLPGPEKSPTEIASGPDGALWFPEPANGQVGRITTAGAVSEFYVSEGAGQITTGPDGALWFNEYSDIGRITTGGAVSEFAASGHPRGIAAGPDGALWFTQIGALQIGRITTGGAISEFAVPTVARLLGHNTAGPHGALWFIETNGIGRIGTDGRSQVFALPRPGSEPIGIIAGPDGALWFTERQTARIGRITTNGRISEVRLRSYRSTPWEIAAGPDRALWFTEPGVNKIGRLTPGRKVSRPTSVGVSGVGGNVSVKLPGAKAFTPLTGERQVPLTTIVDARRGGARVCLATAKGQMCGEFSGGMFRVFQPAPHLRRAPGHVKAHKAVAEVRLVGGSFRRCARASKGGVARVRSIRRLSGENFDGTFRVRGSFALLTAGPGAGPWQLKDGCRSTEARAAGQSGVVTDLVRRRNVLLKAGRSYVARMPGHHG
jgi:virginiamycin B lyase